MTEISHPVPDPICCHGDYDAQLYYRMRLEWPEGEPWFLKPRVEAKPPTFAAFMDEVRQRVAHCLHLSCPEQDAVRNFLQHFANLLMNCAMRRHALQMSRDEFLATLQENLRTTAEQGYMIVETKHHPLASRGVFIQTFVPSDRDERVLQSVHTKVVRTKPNEKKFVCDRLLGSPGATISPVLDMLRGDLSYLLTIDPSKLIERETEVRRTLRILTNNANGEQWGEPLSSGQSSERGESLRGKCIRAVLDAFAKREPEVWRHEALQARACWESELDPHRATLRSIIDVYFAPAFQDFAELERRGPLLVECVLGAIEDGSVTRDDLEHLGRRLRELYRSHKRPLFDYPRYFGYLDMAIFASTTGLERFKASIGSAF